jgi:hypothetical protein
MRGYSQTGFPQKRMPIFPETSALRSPRDPDSALMVHKKHEAVSTTLLALSQEVRQLRNTLNRLRIRSSQTGGGTGAMNFVGEYDPGRTYSAGQIVIISMGANAGTYAYINATPSAGNAPYAGGGWWAQFPMGPSGMWL